MSLQTTVLRRETPAGPETITVISSIDDEGAEIRVIHARNDAVVEDSIPHWGADPEAGRRWVEQHRAAHIADGYRLDQ